MSVASAKAMRYPVGLDEFIKRLGQAFERGGVSLNYLEELELPSTGRLVLVAGVSGPFRGSNALSLVFQGARYVPFFLRITKGAGETTDVVAMAGGAEGVFGVDFGRNSGFLRSLFEKMPEGVEVDLETARVQGAEPAPASLRDGAPLFWNP